MSPFISYNQSFKKKYSSIISDWTYILLCLMTFGTNFVTISLSDVCLLEVICQTIYSFCDSGDILRISMSLIILFSNTDYHLLKGKLFRASSVLISNCADSTLEDIWQQNKFCLRMWTTFQVDTAMTAVSAGPGKSASQIFFYDWSDNYRRVIKVEHPGDYHESQGTRRAREQVVLAMLQL